jgi:16S rRNA (cytidine1402-2'-O)-methyltransferase
MIACEDTRVTRKLLDHYEITTPTSHLYQLQKTSGAMKPKLRTEYFIEQLKNGKKVALTTDAGTPGIADPGNRLVGAALEENISIVPIPGVSALATLVSVSGIDMTKFSFLGFPPHKKGRETFFKEVAALESPAIYFDSVHRVVKNLELLQSLAPEKKVILGRELTKMFEEVVRGSAEETIKYFAEHADKLKGEFVIIVY